MFLIVSGCINAVLNLILVIGFSLSVVGVAVATVISQMISCILVLRCLYKSEGSYQLRFSKLKINKKYMIQIFQVGVPAGIQSTVINFSNVLLQSSVNSFGSVAKQFKQYGGSFPVTIKTKPHGCAMRRSRGGDRKAPSSRPQTRNPCTTKESSRFSLQNQMKSSEIK